MSPVLFLDIAGYTRLSEQMDARQLNRLVQNYFSSFLEIIHEHQGDVNEAAVDGLMVIFQNDRSPIEHALATTRAAFAIQRRVEELNEEFRGVFSRFISTSASIAVQRWSAPRSLRPATRRVGLSLPPDR